MLLKKSDDAPPYVLVNLLDVIIAVVVTPASSHDDRQKIIKIKTSDIAKTAFIL